MISQETADKIKKMITIPLDFDMFCDELNSLVSEQEYVKGRGVGVKVEDEPICPYCGVKKIKCWKPQDYPDGEYTWECDNSQCEDEGFTKPCVCGSTMHLQHHWECLNCKKGTKETDEEISLHMWTEFVLSDYYSPEMHEITKRYEDWLKG